MAAAAPSSLFSPLAIAWRQLALRSDVDDIILALLGRFSLERIYAGGRDKDTYQHLVITLLAQLNTIFFVQRLTLPAENLLVGWYLGFIVSWEVTLRSVEFVLQVVVEGRDSLWENQALRDKYLADFLLSALRVLTLHPRVPANQRAKDRRDRLARVHQSLEQVFDSYPGPKSALLLVCKEVTNQLQADPTVLGLPQKLRHELPNLASELYPLSDCLLPTSISELAPHDNDFDIGWLPRFLALRDVSNFVVGASVQYSANRETRDVHLQSSSARSRNAVLSAFDRLRIPTHLSKRDLMAVFSSSFRTILPDTLEFSTQSSPDSLIDEYELDALDTLCARLHERQIIHRVSDVDLMQKMSEVMRSILLQDDPSGQSRPTRPTLYAVNCRGCHLLGGSQLRSFNIELPHAPGEGLELTFPPKTSCIYCGEAITTAREVNVVRRTWELLRPLEPDADTINVERHLPTRFELLPSKADLPGLTSAEPEQSHVNPPIPSPLQSATTSRQQDAPLREPLYPNTSPYLAQMQSPNEAQNFTHAQQELQSSTDPSPFSPPPHTLRRPSQQSSILSPTESGSLLAPRSIPLLTTPEKRKTGWRSKFTTARKPSTGASGDTSSLSSTTLEAQRLEEISLGALSSSRKASGKGRNAKNIHVLLSQSSTYALFWTQLLIQIWDVATSPPSMTRAISTESTCILATVGRVHLAYIIGTRDQKLTLRIVNLIQPSPQVVEYRIPSSLWCRCIAIDPQENYVVVGFDSCVVRFFKTANTDQPREDRLHTLYHQDCKGCPPVETLKFSNDGLALLASTRHPKSGIIQLYSWRFPFTSFQELTSCRYLVPLHESEDNGISSAILRSGSDGEDNLICLTTWTQSGTPALIQPHDGYRSEIKTDQISRHGKLGNRIQCAEFSPSGRDLAIVNDKGYLYHVSNLNSSPVDIRRLATSKELTAKTDSFSMSFMTLSDEECVVLGWADSSKATGWIKKVPIMSRGNVYSPETQSLAYMTPSSLQGDGKQPLQPPVELPATEPDASNKILRKPIGLPEDGRH